MSERKGVRRKASIVHFQRRLMMRYEISLSKEQVEEVNRRIKAGDYARMTRQSKGRRLYLININNQEVLVGYNVNQGTVQTAFGTDFYYNEDIKTFLEGESDDA